MKIKEDRGHLLRRVIVIGILIPLTAYLSPLFAQDDKSMMIKEILKKVKLIKKKKRKKRKKKKKKRLKKKR